MNNSENTIGKIVPAYDGNFSTTLRWNEEVLMGFCKAADLRTTIYVKSGEANSQATTENFGETLAWKRIASPTNLLKVGADKEGFVDISPIQAASAEIYINHRLVTDYVQDKSKGRFNESLFADTFNDLTKVGLKRLLAREKLRIGICSGLLTGTTALCLGLGTGLAYVGGEFMLGSGFINIDSVYPRIGGAFVAARGMFLDVQIMSDVIRDYFHPESSLYPYINSFRDRYNPLKPVKDYLAGQIFLATKGRKIVEYEPNDQK